MIGTWTQKIVEAASSLDTMRAGVSMSAALRGLALALMVCSCANAGNPGTGGDDQPKIDAAVKHDSGTSQPDTPPPIDAPGPDSTPVTVDAMIDAGAMSLFCNGNNECTVAGECCFSLSGPGFCVPGTPVFGACLPD